MAGLASSAIVARESPIINVSTTRETVETAYRLAVILWLSPILLNPAVRPALAPARTKLTAGPGDGCARDPEPTVHDGGGDGHLDSGGDPGGDPRPLTPPDAWTQSPNGSDSDDAEEGPIGPGGPGLVRLEADCPSFSGDDDGNAGKDTPDQLDVSAFLEGFAECPDNFDTTALEQFLHAFEAEAPDVAASSVVMFSETTPAEAHAVATDLWNKWKQPELPEPGEPPANFLQAFKELFPN